MSDTVFPASSLPGLVLVSRAAFYGRQIQEAYTGAEFRLNRRSTAGYRYEYELRFARGTGSHTEWQTLQGLYDDHGGCRESFLLTDPVDGATRRVRFDEDELTLEVVVPGIYSCQFDLVTVGETSSGEWQPLDGAGGLY